VAGEAGGRRIPLRLVSVRAPARSVVDVRCRGRGCPFKRWRQRVVRKARTVRVPRLERRSLRAGTVLEFRVHARGQVGKSTRCVLRRQAAPARMDACVSSARKRMACPA